MIFTCLRVLFTTTLLFVFLDSNAQAGLFEQFADIEPISHRENRVYQGWENYFFSEADCKCVYGDDFFIALKKADTTTQNIMISLQGGGACWPGVIQCKPTADDADVEKASFASQLAEKLPDNWHQVFIPYCDGSVYMGMAERDYDNDAQTDHWHDGLKVSVASLSFVKKQFPEASKIFLTGCSAGGYGTILQLRFLRYLYPQATIYVMNESGPGLFRPDSTTWETIKTAWNLDRLIPEDCERCNGQLIYWYEEMLKDPKIKIGLYSSFQDEVIGQAFLKLEPQSYESLLMGATNYLHDKYPNQFKRFFIEGNSHCVDDRNYEIKGTKYWDWVLSFLNESQDWVDLLER